MPISPSVTVLSQTADMTTPADVVGAVAARTANAEVLSFATVIAREDEAAKPLLSDSVASTGVGSGSPRSETLGSDTAGLSVMAQSKSDSIFNAMAIGQSLGSAPFSVADFNVPPGSTRSPAVARAQAYSTQQTDPDFPAADANASKASVALGLIASVESQSIPIAPHFAARTTTRGSVHPSAAFPGPVHALATNAVEPKSTLQGLQPEPGAESTPPASNLTGLPSERAFPGRAESALFRTGREALVVGSDTRGNRITLPYGSTVELTMVATSNLDRGSTEGSRTTSSIAPALPPSPSVANLAFAPTQPDALPPWPQASLQRASTADQVLPIASFLEAPRAATSSAVLLATAATRPATAGQSAGMIIATTQSARSRPETESIPRGNGQGLMTRTVQTTTTPRPHAKSTAAIAVAVFAPKALALAVGDASPAPDRAIKVQAPFSVHDPAYTPSALPSVMPSNVRTSLNAVAPLTPPEPHNTVPLLTESWVLRSPDDQPPATPANLQVQAPLTFPRTPISTLGDTPETTTTPPMVLPVPGSAPCSMPQASSIATWKEKASPPTTTAQAPSIMNLLVSDQTRMPQSLEITVLKPNIETKPVAVPSSRATPLQAAGTSVSATVMPTPTDPAALGSFASIIEPTFTTNETRGPPIAPLVPVRVDAPTATGWTLEAEQQLPAPLLTFPVAPLDHMVPPAASPLDGSSSAPPGQTAAIVDGPTSGITVAASSYERETSPAIETSPLSRLHMIFRNGSTDQLLAAPTNSAPPPSQSDEPLAASPLNRHAMQSTYVVISGVSAGPSLSAPVITAAASTNWIIPADAAADGTVVIGLMTGRDGEQLQGKPPASTALTPSIPATIASATTTSATTQSPAVAVTTNNITPALPEPSFDAIAASARAAASAAVPSAAFTEFARMDTPAPDIIVHAGRAGTFTPVRPGMRATQLESPSTLTQQPSAGADHSAISGLSPPPPTGGVAGTGPEDFESSSEQDVNKAPARLTTTATANAPPQITGSLAEVPVTEVEAIAANGATTVTWTPATDPNSLVVAPQRITELVEKPPPGTPAIAGTDTTIGTGSAAAQATIAISALARQSGLRALHVRLHPDELGGLTIDVARSVAGTVKVLLTADRGPTLDLLLRDQAQIHRALDQAGVPPEGRTLTFQLESQHNPGATCAAASVDDPGLSGGGQGNSARNWRDPGSPNGGTQHSSPSPPDDRSAGVFDGSPGASAPSRRGIDIIA